MTYNYGKQIRVCSKVSYILKENNDATDLSPPLRIWKIIDFTTDPQGVEECAHKIMKDSASKGQGARGSGP